MSRREEIGRPRSGGGREREEDRGDEERER